MASLGHNDFKTVKNYNKITTNKGKQDLSIFYGLDCISSIIIQGVQMGIAHLSNGIGLITLMVVKSQKYSAIQ